MDTLYAVPVEPHELTEWRKAHGLTQQELADKLGLHLNAINYWEKGHRRPAGRMLDLALKELERELHSEAVSAPAPPPRGRPRRKEVSDGQGHD